MGWEMYIILPNDRAEPSNDFRPTVRAEWKLSNRPRAGQRTVEAQSGQSVKDQFSDRDRLLSALSTSSHAHFSIMATGQELIPAGDAAAVLYDDASMNGSNGPPSPS